MIGYTKFFTSLLDSSVWMLSKEARLLWVTILLKKNRDQIVDCSIPGLAHAARLSVEETISALKELEAPDPYSQTTTDEGRRIRKLDRGWLVINGELYRNKMSAEERKAYKAAKQAEYRLREAEKKREVQQAKAKKEAKEKEIKKRTINGAKHEGTQEGAKESIKAGIEYLTNNPPPEASPFREEPPPYGDRNVA